MQESRLFKIVYYLLEHGHATAPELAERFEVSVRTIYRDIEALSEAGIPLYTEPGRNGGIYLIDEFVLNRTLLSREEQKELLAALQSLNAACFMNLSLGGRKHIRLLLCQHYGKPLCLGGKKAESSQKKLSRRGVSHEDYCNQWYRSKRYHTFNERELSEASAQR